MTSAKSDDAPVFDLASAMKPNNFNFVGQLPASDETTPTKQQMNLPAEVVFSIARQNEFHIKHEELESPSIKKSELSIEKQ
jgi:hypothetical protein